MLIAGDVRYQSFSLLTILSSMQATGFLAAIPTIDTSRPILR